MQQFHQAWVLLMLFNFGLSQYVKCPTFCVCYKWKTRSRIDCVGQGLLDVNIGLDGDDIKGRKLNNGSSLIQVLDLSRNSISSLHSGAFSSGDLQQLEALHLSHNSIAHISPSALRGLKRLQLLDLSCNRLRRNAAISPKGFLHPVLLPAKMFIDAPYLRALRLGHNPLEKEILHEKMSVQDGEPLLIAPNLEFLDLGSCHLGHLGLKSFTYLESLRMLNLSDNQLISLNPLALRNLKNLEELQLQHNPWPCSDTDEMATLDSWLSRKGFNSVCPEKKFGKIVASHSRGPQKAKDESSLLYYYQQLGTLTKETSSPPESPHSDMDVEVFDKTSSKHRHIEKLNLDSSYSNCSVILSDQIKKFYCTVYGIPLGWFLGMSFLTGIFVAFGILFLYATKPCSWNKCLIGVQGMMSSSNLRRNYPNMRKKRGWTRPLSMRPMSNANVGELLLMHESEEEQLNVGL